MLILEKITKYFNKGTINEVFALKSLDLIVERADFVTVIGSNGAGKSTMLNCVAGGFLPDSGRLVLSGHDITKWPEHKRAKFLGRVFQDPLKGTCASLTIEQNLALALRRGTRRGLATGVKDKDRELFREKLALLGLGLEFRLKDQVGLLSGGQRQALTMLMATMVKPDVLLLDEHTAALDPKTATQIIELTEQIVEAEKLTTLMVTHNMNQALAMGNRLVMLHQGEIILDVEGEDKRKLTVEDLLQQFYAVRGEKLTSDRMLLA
ncbi:ABC transporter ATP-binding protein [Oceanidesulfovibrio marinus]|uniref:ABC transporter ATP-binding protein n=1 Tax=Oceanidesulfovibrio marinus TaxID=370038 RepID=A0A6P1ZA87_9BACT|nr:ATP-binding cassette domain-containing protein [Oceanidesulfovibrio marinus]QJT10875.1 ATP-binding cassette domain-containing protein [Oceanidesulfovibrio marinus]TVM30523.1 ABC transporter ATP-binding protein [Oceanidesulfovibrio marinus]